MSVNNLKVNALIMYLFICYCFRVYILPVFYYYYVYVQNVVFMFVGGDGRASRKHPIVRVTTKWGKRGSSLATGTRKSMSLAMVFCFSRSCNIFRPLPALSLMLSVITPRDFFITILVCRTLKSMRSNLIPVVS